MSGVGSTPIQTGMYKLSDYNPSALPASLVEQQIRYGILGQDKRKPRRAEEDMLRDPQNPQPLVLGGGIWDDILNGINTAANVFEKVAPAVTPFLGML